MSEIPDDIRRVAKGVLCDLADEREAATAEGRAFWSGEKAFEIIARALLAERERHTNADKPATTVYGNLLWRHMDACRKHGVPSPEQERLFKLSEEFRAVYPDDCKVWEDRYPGTDQPEKDNRVNSEDSAKQKTMVG